jgi:hypothetical protein
LIAAIAALIVLTGQAGTSSPRALEGTSLLLRTEDGRVWLQALPLDTGGELVIHTVDDTMGPPPGITLRAETGRKYVQISEGQEFPLVHMGVLDSCPAFLMHRKDMTIATGMGLDLDGDGYIAAMNCEGQRIWAGPASANIQTEAHTERESEKKK